MAITYTLEDGTTQQFDTPDAFNAYLTQQKSDTETASGTLPTTTADQSSQSGMVGDTGTTSTQQTFTPEYMQTAGSLTLGSGSGSQPPFGQFMPYPLPYTPQGGTTTVESNVPSYVPPPTTFPTPDTLDTYAQGYKLFGTSPTDKYSDFNALKQAVGDNQANRITIERLAHRMAGYTDPFGSGAAATWGGNTQNQTKKNAAIYQLVKDLNDSAESAFDLYATSADDKFQTKEQLMADPAALKNRLAMRLAGYNQPFGGGRATQFFGGNQALVDYVQNTMAQFDGQQEFMPPVVQQPAPTGVTSGLPDIYKGSDGNMRSDLLGGQYTDPKSIPPQVLQERLAMRLVGFTGDFGSGAANEWVSQGNNRANVDAIKSNLSAPSMSDLAANRFSNPMLPTGSFVTAAQTGVLGDQFINPSVAQLGGVQSIPTALANTAQAGAITPTDANLMQDVATTQQGAQQILDGAVPATMTVSPESIMQGAQQFESSVSSLQAATGQGIFMNNEVQRKLQAGELISGAANAAIASAYLDAVQAATATPTAKATVKGQLDDLMRDFEGGATPSWAAGAMRSATAAMIRRGVGASSMAGQAIVQAAMESALPIAQADAATFASFEQQNLSNRQQRAMLAAEQRAAFLGMEFTQEFQARVANAAKISDIANMNFTADQQVQLENSRIANTINLQNLSNRQALVMAEAAALAQLDVQNLDNRQAAAVQNAQAFLQRDLTNADYAQQTMILKTQQRMQSLFTDTAATNAAAQFNATSKNQVDQFFAQLSAQTQQFNASQANAQSQFNAGQRNVIERFNAELQDQREQFNANNRLVIDQSNAAWRRQIATQDIAAINRANELNALNILEISNSAYNDMWQLYADSMEWAWTSAENSLDRANRLALGQLDATTRQKIADEQSSSAAGTAIGSLIGTIGSAWVSSGFKLPF